MKLIAEKTKQYREQVIEFKAEDKDFTATTLIHKVDNPTKRITVGELFQERIQELKNTKRLGYAESHKTVYHSLLHFNGHLDIYFSKIDKEWLQNYETWLRKNENKENTIDIRLRTLRTIYNIAIEKQFVKPECYPFRSYKVSKLHQDTAKRALSKTDILNIINYYSPEKSGHYRQFSIDLFAFSYFVGGINITDIAHLKDENIIDNRLSYRRQKTKQLITLPLQHQAIKIINKYKLLAPPYLFPILSKQKLTESQQRNRIRQVTKSVNKHLKLIGKELHLPLDLTTYVARHSFATVLKRSGVNTSIICEAMGHSSEKVTQIYLDSFDNEQVDTAMQKLL